MTAAPDPYYKWLGIPPEEQPPDHYRLLGLRRFESDAEVISTAFDRQMAHVRTYQTGPHGPLSQKLLNELAAAHVCLADPAKKSAYDHVLRNAAPVDEVVHQSSPGGHDAKIASPVKASDGAKVFGPFEILQRSGGGRFALLFKARRRDTGQVVSLKLLPKEGAAVEGALRRFRREMELTARLNHPNLIAAVESGEHHGVPYLATEYVVGTDLATLVQTQGPLAVRQALEYTAQAARGLGYLHDLGVYHRNVKPANLLVDVRGQLKVTNLLLARLDNGSLVSETGEEDLTRPGQMMGSVDYLAPEQAADASGVDQRADIYSLGCTLYFLLTGRPPYEGKSLMGRLVAHRTAPIPSLRVARPDIPPRVERVFRSMLAKEPAGRPATMSHVAVALERGSPGELRSPLPRWFWAAAAATVVLLGLILLAVWN